MYPSVKELPLSQERITNVISEMLSSFEKEAIGRRILRPCRIPESLPEFSAPEYMKWGFSHVVDKIWFVDGVFNGESYGYSGIGSDYGTGLAEAETNYITQTVLKQCNLKIGFSGKIMPSDILRGLELLQQNQCIAKTILTNVRDHLSLWHHKNMVPQGQLVVSKSFSGYTHDIPIEFFRGLPDGISIIVDSDKLGELWIKKELKDAARISEIKGAERDKILKELPNIEPNKLDESVEVLAYEVIKANIVNSKAAVIIQEEPITTTKII